MHWGLCCTPSSARAWGCCSFGTSAGRKTARAEPMLHLLQGPALAETWEGGGRRALHLGSLGFFSSVLLLCWVYIKLFLQITINNREYKFYNYADFGGPEVFVTVTACLFKLLENNYLFSPFCRVLSEYLLLANTLINWLSLWVRVFTENQTWCCQTDCTTCEAEYQQECSSSLGNVELSGLLV